MLIVGFCLVAVNGKLSTVEVQRHLDQGKKLLHAGQLNDALTHYHAAVGKELVVVVVLLQGFSWCIR